MSFLKATKSDIITRINILCFKLGDNLNNAELGSLGKEDLIRILVQLENNVFGPHSAFSGASKSLRTTEKKEDISPFDTMPDEMMEIIIKMAMGSMNTQERYDFLSEILPRVSIRFKNLSSRKLFWRSFSPFERMPNELAERILRMSMEKQHVLAKYEFSGKYDFLVDSIAKVSSRFKRLASLKTLWKGQVNLLGIEGREKVKQVLAEFLNDGVKDLTLSNFDSALGTGELMQDDIIDTAIKCPKLDRLSIMMKLNSWPTFNRPWTSLKYLELHVENDIFAEVNLRETLPKLKTFYIAAVLQDETVEITLPNMKECKSLDTIGLLKGKFLGSGLPHGLKYLFVSLDSTIVNMDKAFLEQYFDNCDIEILEKVSEPVQD